MSYIVRRFDVRKGLKDNIWSRYIGSSFLSEQDELKNLKKLYCLHLFTKDTLYELYTRTKYWRRLKSQALDRDNYVCRTCGNSENLQLDHIRYTRYGEESLDDVQTLCMYCHALKTVDNQGYLRRNILKERFVSKDDEMFTLIPEEIQNKLKT